MQTIYRTKKETNIYRQHEAAFPRVSAFVVIDKNKERVATIAFHFPKDGAGKLYCYLHVIGITMVRGYAGGYGYDKKSAAIYDASEKLELQSGALDELERDAATNQVISDFKIALKKGADAGAWDNELRSLGYTLLQAV